MLGQRRRRWPKINAALRQRLLSARSTSTYLGNPARVLEHYTALSISRLLGLSNQVIGLWPLCKTIADIVTKDIKHLSV